MSSFKFDWSRHIDLLDLREWKSKEDSVLRIERFIFVPPTLPLNSIRTQGLLQGKVESNTHGQSGKLLEGFALLEAALSNCALKNENLPNLQQALSTKWEIFFVSRSKIKFAPFFESLSVWEGKGGGGGGWKVNELMQVNVRTGESGGVGIIETTTVLHFFWKVAVAVVVFVVVVAVEQ